MGIPTLDEPDVSRADQLRRRATYASVSVGTVLAVTKLAAWLITGSVTVLSSLLDSFVDVAASTVILVSVHHALRPPDRSHRFGHGKAEPLGALAQAAFIAGSGLFGVFQAVDRPHTPEPPRSPGRPRVGEGKSGVGDVSDRRSACASSIQETHHHDLQTTPDSYL